MRGASNMNIHYDVTGLLTAAWRSHSGQIVWAAWINCELAREEEGGGGFWTHSTYTGYPGSAGGRQLDRWRWATVDCLLLLSRVCILTPRLGSQTGMLSCDRRVTREGVADPVQLLISAGAGKHVHTQESCCSVSWMSASRPPVPFFHLIIVLLCRRMFINRSIGSYNYHVLFIP